ncbi:cyclodeaminase/cyclohydrolase family protein [Actinophytocola glycyrrhizae]|uniref:Cyclodeaminase/cyclohydrolase family protein n=1 Tax=Actinophytocola glycyrrhizae TaxID=2044873 RepID=A0ABV9S2S8_9PSEU
MKSFLAAVAARTAAPGGGAVAATTAASAAALVAMAARFSADEPLAATADELRADLLRLADADADAYTAYLAAKGEARKAALRAATEVPKDIAAVAGRVAELARGLVADGNPNLTGDARVAELLAHAAAEAATVLVEINTGSSTP